MLAFVALFFVAFFPQAIFGGKFLIAGDAYFYSYPLRTVAWEIIRGGQLPLWTPHVLSGYPLLAMAQLAIGYPLTWGYLFLPGHWAEQIYVLAPFLLSPMFTYAYAREVGRSRTAALLAGLGFGYGGMMCSGISNSGMLTNSMLWLPLVLIPVDRARRGGRGRFTSCLVGATAAYSMSVLNGHGQSFVYTGALVAAYGLFLSLFPVQSATVGEAGRRADDADNHTATRGADDERTTRGWFDLNRWRPLIVAIGAIGLAACVAAFQILETMRAARRSTRRALSYEALGEGSFTFARAARSLVAPLYHYIDVTTYVAPLVLMLALLACATAVWRRRAEGTDARVYFWLAVAAAAWVLMLGSNTPFHHVVFRIPVVNSFRVPSRHALEWTFALAVLSAYGWDALAGIFRARRAKLQTTARRQRGELMFGWLALALAATVGALWWRATVQPPVPGSNSYTALAESSYLWWKACFVSLLFAALWLAFRAHASSRSRKLLLVSVVLLTCYVEQFAIISCWWGGLGLDAERFAVVSPVTKHLQTLAPTENRVYTRTGLFAEEFTLTPRLEGANLTALHGLHNVAGMEPLIFERYSRALGGVGPDSVTPRAGFPPNDDLFQERSRVLDLLNTTHVVSFTNLAPNFEPSVYKDDISFAPSDAHITLAPGQSKTLAGATAGEGDTLALVTVLSNSIDVKQGETVAKVRLHFAGGATVERELRAGLDTAEWAHERADVRAVIRHSLAHVFDTHAGDEGNSFFSHRYLARVPIGARAHVEKIEITNATTGATLNVLKATLYDAASKNSTPLVLTSSGWWETIYQKNGALVMRNLRAQPRAWLVGEAEAVDGEEALHRIRGESEHAFDPRRTALLEVAANELPTLAGGELLPESSARIVEYQASRLVIETSAPMATVLVVSEMIYPGWEATVDGTSARIHATDYLLRGVVVPAGAHRVEMRYRATAARMGAIISVCTLLLLCGLAFYDQRTTTTRVQKRSWF